jgi:hypothetical protein
MRRFTVTFAAAAMALAAAGVHAKNDDIDINRLNGNLDQLASDPVLGSYAQAEQARARDAVNRLAQAKSRDREHDLYLAERRVDLARAAAQLQDAQAKSNQLDREHDQILLENSRNEADIAQRELEHQRMQYQLAQEESARLQQQGEAASQAAEEARAEAEQAKKLAAAQSKVAGAAKREAALAAQAAKAMRSQMQGDSSSSDTAAPTTHKKAKKPADDQQ